VIPALSTVLIILTSVHLPQNAAIAVMFITFIINLFTFYLHDSFIAVYEDKLRSMLHAQEKEYYFAQCQVMQESVDRIKSIRHDIKLHLAALKGYTVDNKAATNYLNQLLGDIEESEIYSDTGNIAFDSIINFKLKNVKGNIKLDTKIFIPPKLNMEVVDVVTILGNLLDNVLNAVAKVEEKIIKMDIAFDKGCLFIKIDNTFNGEVNYSEEHSHGLKNIRKSVEKYNGHMDITHEENIFSVGILLYVDDYVNYSNQEE
jgi:sensor histidine kinase regulating citrate/malate metabolism